ncbi:MAG: dihydropyrimidinase [Coriobacteriales bacterium]|jgi:dihydropyrimidinase|nr:dihydropyrimidinase [Coriobacteriales bacterium]
MIIVNGTIVTGHGETRQELRVKGGRIVALGQGLAEAFPDEERIDATGLLVLPGGVDAHTHMDLLVGTLRATDSFLTGTVAAACGGTTTIIDHMAFGPAGAALQHQIDVYHALADDKAVVDYGFHGVVDHVDGRVLAQMGRLASEGVTSLKFYMTYDNRLSDDAILRLLARSSELGLLPCVHCEDHAMLTWLRERFRALGMLSVPYHALSRPASCEAEAVFRVLTLAHAVGGAPLYLVHMSSAAALEAVGGLSFDADNAVLETCPQYLVLDEVRYGLPGNEGLKYVMSPPLRTEADQAALWAALSDGRIDAIGSDHCPFDFKTDKMLGASDFTLCPNGVPGVELRLPLLYSEGVVRRGMPLSRMVELCSTLPAKRFGVFPQKGTIAVGSDADLVLFDPARKVRVTHALLHERVDYTPYEGFELTGWPVMTLSRGEVIVREGEFLGSEGRGRYLHRALPDLDPH